MAENEISSGKKYFAELFGTFVLVFFGCGSAVIAGDKIGFLGISFAFGVSVLVLVYAIGPISGCHINPAISIAMLVAKKINAKDAFYYIIFQCIGAIVAAGLLLGIASGMPGYEIAVNGLGQNGYEIASPGGFTLASAFIAELVLTFLFLMVIFGATAKKAAKGFEGIAIGLTLFLIHIVGIPITGTSVNPARSLGPALFVGDVAMDQLWLFLIAPVIGAIIAAAVWKLLLETKE